MYSPKLKHIDLKDNVMIEMSWAVNEKAGMDLLHDTQKKPSKRYKYKDTHPYLNYDFFNILHPSIIFPQI